MAGVFLVLAQCACFVLVVYPKSRFQLDFLTVGLLLLGALLAVWTFAHNRPGNFSALPRLRKGASLITTGPYRWIRHPMYSSILLIMAGHVWAYREPVTFCAWLALAVVFLCKAVLEERDLLAKRPEYEAYMNGRSRFVPFVF